jgi:predicted nucleic acid-binding protein
MPVLFWDASGLTKRYAFEAGTPTVNALFAAAPRLPMVSTYLGYTETFATLWRKRNRGALSQGAFRAAASALQAEVLNRQDFGLLALETADFLSSVLYIERHSINSADAVILATCLRYAAAQASGDPCVLVAADQRLLRAADAEGLRTLNPETLVPADVPAFLASL